MMTMPLIPTARRLGPALALAAGLMMCAPTAASAREAKAAVPGEPTYIEIRPLSVAMTDRARLRGTFMIDLSLEVTGEPAVAEAERLKPRLKNAYLRTLTDLANTRLSPNRAPDLELVGQSLQYATDQVLGEGTATVLIQEARVRRN